VCVFYWYICFYIFQKKYINYIIDCIIFFFISIIYQLIINGHCIKLCIIFIWNFEGCDHVIHNLDITNKSHGSVNINIVLNIFVQANINIFPRIWGLITLSKKRCLLEYHTHILTTTIDFYDNGGFASSGENDDTFFSNRYGNGKCNWMIIIKKRILKRMGIY